MSWIKHIPFKQAEGKLLKLYKRVKGPDNNVDNIMLAHSLRPHTMEGHMVLYKNVLHHTGNKIPKWFLEAMGVLTSMLNGCHYCVDHHFSGMERLVDNNERSKQIRLALESEDFSNVFNDRQTAAMRYTKKLSCTPAQMLEEDISKLRSSGWDDGEILEINQVVAYFNYANRTVLGLGVHTDGDLIGLSPNVSEDPDNWNHT
jgi:uncharacterized peroxidase-related enzyme